MIRPSDFKRLQFLQGLEMQYHAEARLALEGGEWEIRKAVRKLRKVRRAIRKITAGGNW